MMRSWLPWIGLCVVLASLPRCAVMDESAAVAFVDPGKIVILNCREIALRLKPVVAEERKLKRLMDQAATDSGGEFVAAFAYKPDYLQALGQRRMLVEEAQKKNCKLPPDLRIISPTPPLPPPTSPPPAAPPR